jgi:hypothetical protein
VSSDSPTTGPTDAPGATPSGAEDDALPAVGKVWSDAPQKSLSTIMAQYRNKPAGGAGAGGGAAPAWGADVPEDLKALWADALAALQTASFSFFTLASQGVLVALKDGTAVVRFPNNAAMTAKMMDRQDRREALLQSLASVRDDIGGVTFEVDPNPAPAAPRAAAPPPRRPDPQDEKPRAAEPAEAPRDPQKEAALRAQAEQIPLVKALMGEFDARILRVDETPQH